MKYKIGQFNDSYPPVMDGVAMTVRNYAYWLNRGMGEATVVTLKVPGYVDNDPFPVMRYPSVPLLIKPPYRIGLTHLDPFLQKRLRSKNFDLIHAHSPFSSGQIALRQSRKSGVPLVATFHSKFRDDFMHFIPNKRIVKPIIDGLIRFFEAADEVWIPQETVAETIREYGYRGRYIVMENGTDFPVYEDVGLLRLSARRELGILPEKKVFLFVGQLTEEKNTSFILKALHALRHIDFQFFFVGVGYAQADLQNLAKKLGVDHRVHFLGAVYDRKRLHALYLAADLFLFPSLYDNAPLVLREAAAAQTPALLLNKSTAAEVVTDGFNGFLADAEPKEYAAKIIEVLSDPGKCRAVGRNAAKTISRSWEDIMQEVWDRYVHLIERKKMG